MFTCALALRANKVRAASTDFMVFVPLEKSKRCGYGYARKSVVWTENE